MQRNQLEKAIELRMIMSRCATGKYEEGDDNNYKLLRSEFITCKATKPLLPDFLISCRILDDLWPFIKKRFNTYEDRREFIREQFETLLTHLEFEKLSLHEDVTSITIGGFDCDTVDRMWRKALDRRDYDPEGAITAARSLLESVCKQILTERNIAYDNSYDLPKLYKATARCLKLAPEDHNENILKQILSGMQTTVYGFASLRNELSDAHGQPKGGYKASKRHAQLAVNLAGSVTSFLIETHQEAIINNIAC